eukprot:GHUV01047478.1.p1 GENE.GHUV01047478.1~~GHUV01047478.1.p1  ORF type:complete len:133 (-),score=20.36 GHUV01047478.1:407-805(-)
MLLVVSSVGRGHAYFWELHAHYTSLSTAASYVVSASRKSPTAVATSSQPEITGAASGSQPSPTHPVICAVQAADEGKQIVTYGRDYFNSPWNYMDVASCAIIAILFLLHLTRLSHQTFVILVALEILLLCLR